MKGAFQEWAESERPARFGGAEKVPAMKQMPRRRRHLHEQLEGEGFFDSLKSLGSKVVSGVSSAAQAVGSLADAPLKMKQLYDNAKEYAPKVKSALKNPAIPANFRPVADQLISYMEMVGLGKHKKCPLARHMAHECMERHHAGMYGGAGIADLAANAVKVYNWLKANKDTIHTVLKLPQLEPWGGKMEGILSMVGMGKRPSQEYIDAGVLFMNPRTGHHVIKKGKGLFSALAKGAKFVAKVAPHVIKHAPKALELAKKGVAMYKSMKAPKPQTVEEEMGEEEGEEEMPSGGAFSFSGLLDAGKKAYHTVKKHAPMAKHLLEQYGGETGKMLSEKATSYGLGRGRRGPSARNAIVKQVMQERGLGMIAASKFVKEHGLY
jgi:hypothetical protein